MSIVDHNGQPIAYAWNDIAAQEKYESNRTLRLMPDEEFERRFPHLLRPPEATERRVKARKARAARG